jgi:sugar O-acyltransferase (sialic acid O-acetyltransferase NeuD family)
MPIELLILLGAGGHAKVVCDAATRAGLAADIEFRDDDVTLAGMRPLGRPIRVPIGPLEQLGYDVHVAIGNNATRSRLAMRLQEVGRPLTTISHPNAIVSAWARIGEGVFIAAGATVAPDATIEKCAIINHGSIVDHDCHLGAWVHIAPNATLGGGVHIGEGTLIGAGAVVLPGVAVGKWAIVGAGAVVTEPVADGTVVVGVPARLANHHA